MKTQPHSNKSTGSGGVSAPSPGPASATPPLEADVTQETLDATPGRLITFLRGVGTRPPIRAALEAVGYDAEEHARGWELLHGCSGFEPGAPIAPVVDRDVVESINALDAQDERVHSRVDATLKSRAPAARKALLLGIEPGTGAESVAYFHKLLERLDQLDKGTLEGVSKDESHAATAVLAKRGLTPAWRKQTAAQVKLAERYSATTSAGATGASREALQQSLIAARAFYEEWSRIAHTELRRKDYLIVLGLATRKSPTKGAGKAAPKGGAKAADAGAKAHDASATSADAGATSPDAAKKPSAATG